ncbi:MAG: hypothetical protein A2Z95_04315 [Gallionellales bacterium GWA2_60_18]|nr:MAG: hypothetical protein A2Z95_04315 [Gallionellales bacterium GWA2_60_18]
MVVVAATEPLVPALMKPMLDGTFVHKDQAMMRNCTASSPLSQSALEPLGLPVFPVCSSLLECAASS